MNRLRCFLVVFFSVILWGNVSAQGVAIGQWRDHLSYNYCISVTEGNNNIIYCATRDDVFSYDKNDGAVERLSKVNGLSDVGVSAINFNQKLDVLLVAYTSANIDIIEGNRVINISDIKRKNLPGKKNINHILFVNNYAYLSCGFGIVVVDLVRKEIKDTYYIGPSGSHIEVFGLAYDGTSLFAATESGIFQASVNNPNLANFESWTKHTAIPHANEKFNTIVSFNNKIITNLSDDSQANHDTLFMYDGATWNYLLPTQSETRRSLENNHNQLVIAGFYNVNAYDTAFNIKLHTSIPYPNYSILDKDNILWIADNQNGLIKSWNVWMLDYIYPNGPRTNDVFAISVEDSKLWVASGGRDDAWSNVYHGAEVFSFIDETWSSYNDQNISALDTIFDITCVAVNPNNPTNIFAGSWGRGLLEFNNNTLTTLYKETNSSLLPISGMSGYYSIRIGGLIFDNDGNLWVTNSNVSEALSVKKTNGAWKSFDFSGLVSNSVVVGNLVIDNSGQKWIILPKGNGILVFNDNGTIDNTADDKVKKLSNAQGNGSLPSNNVLSLAVDRDGEVWVGTDMGVVVFYSPENVFSGSNFDAQPITLVQDGHAQHLLETENINVIVVDGANRKWIGTQNSGVFLMSSDGITEIHHFTAENSPLFSNVIISIAIDHKTGEVFFGTDKGIISYKDEATKGGEEFSEVYAYPNPVREDYTGLIGIKGLTADAYVKITDIAGNLIYETTAKGGQAIWDGKNFNGEKAKTGVYLVFCASQDGSQKFVTKIMVIN